MNKCIVCGNVLKSEDYGICNNCIKRNITLDNCIELGKEWTEEITINGFLASYFREFVDEMEDLLIEAIKSKQEHDPECVEKALEEYFNYDRECFISWLEEKWNIGR